ncbi:hypothetical protein SAMN04488505_105168 [Chitinophaga rupis]|uniref:Uncharacterized protein n=1 Tax=Chitinophaga rupis TaxID=573321 RepID=A0A1H7ZT55_9BACT|nr:hypothetical protein [Chitinophaga rupis]SEM60669.1 hypothetical protein SAMN04488505_105168 [Chitinophaga rupis]
MQNESNTIFDQDFLQETFVRRRQLMPLALKIYVWFYMLFSVYNVLTFIYINIQRWLDVLRYESFDKFLLLTIFTGLAFPVLRFLSNLFIWLERKSAILTGIIITVLHILYSCVSFVIIYNMFGRLDLMIWTVPLVLLEIPYLVLLLNIRKRWEQTGISGNEQEQHFKGLK